jgi:hypothetical protein
MKEELTMDELDGVWKWRGHDLNEALSQNFPRGTEENDKVAQSGDPVSWLRFKPGTYRLYKSGILPLNQSVQCSGDKAFGSRGHDLPIMLPFYASYTRNFLVLLYCPKWFVHSSHPTTCTLGNFNYILASCILYTHDRDQCRALVNTVLNLQVL